MNLQEYLKNIQIEGTSWSDEVFIKVAVNRGYGVNGTELEIYIPIKKGSYMNLSAIYDKITDFKKEKEIEFTPGGISSKASIKKHLKYYNANPPWGQRIKHYEIVQCKVEGDYTSLIKLYDIKGSKILKGTVIEFELRKNKIGVYEKSYFSKSSNFSL